MLRATWLRAACAALLLLITGAALARDERSAVRDLVLEDRPLPLLDSDRDGTPDRRDPDDDGDGVLDVDDRFPFDPTEQVDRDGDGLGDRADPDDDNDGIPDAPEAPGGRGTSTRSDLVGSSDGSFRVDESGAATYRIPVLAVAGTAGVTPALALSYSSRAGNGLAGQGFAIAGLSAIERCRQTLANDGRALPITFSAEDRFCLDGQRLVLVSGTYGAPGSVYRTEIDGFAVVTASGGSAGQPGAFRVERRDGSRSDYGRAPGESSSSALEVSAEGKVRAWAIRRFTDSVGNPIWFEYADGGAGHRISEVRYAYGSAAGPEGEHARIAFRYEARPDPIRRYLGGQAFDVAQRLRSIESWNEGASVRELRLEYLAASGRASATSRLAAVRECAGDHCLPATQFSWSPDAGGFASAPSSFPLAERHRTLTSYELADFDGDGLMDLAWLLRDDDPGHRRNELRYALSNGRMLEPATFSDGSSERAIDYDDVVGDFLNVIDYNADGRQDVLLYDLASGVWQVYLSAPQPDGRWRLSAAPIATPLPNGVRDRESTAPRDTTLGDLNADGLVDALYDRGLSQRAVRLLVRDASQPDASSQAYHFGPEQRLSELQAVVGQPSAAARADFNGDGLLDLVSPFNATRIERVLSPRRAGARGIGSEGFRMLSATPPILYATKPGAGAALFTALGPSYPCGPCQLHRELWVADFNADGLSDVLYTSEDSRGSIENLTPDPQPELQLRLSTGAGLAAPQSLGRLPRESEIQVGYDENQDGYPDLVWRDAAAHALQVRHWEAAALTFGPATALHATSEDAAERHFFLDVNGDGLADLVALRDGSLQTWLAQSSGAPANVVTGITNGLGSALAIAYGTLAASGHYERLTLGGTPGTAAFTWRGAPYARAVTPPDVAAFYAALNQGFELPAGAQTLGRDAPILELSGGLPVVTEVSGSAPRGSADAPGRVDPSATSRIAYFYGEAKLQASGRGFLGFHKIRSVDVQTGIATTTTYRQDFPFAGRPWRTEVRSAQGSLLRDATETWALASGSAAPYQPYVAEAVEQTYDLANGGASQGSLLRAVRTTTRRDAHDNVLELTVETADGSAALVSRRTVRNTYGASEREQRLGRLIRSEVTHERGALAETRVSSFVYGGADAGPLEGLLQIEVIEPDRPDLRRETERRYDGFGNVVETRERASGAPERVSRRVHDPLGRFVDEQYDALGQRTSRVLARDPLGQPALLEDANGALTSREYDALGRLALESRASGAFEHSARVSSAAGCPTGAAYAVSLERGGAGSTYTCFDALAREVRRIAPAFDGSPVWQDSEYDALGRLLRSSAPYAAGAPAGEIFWTTTRRDLLGRVTRVERPDGSETATAYAGLTARTTDPLRRTTSETQNALGERVEVIDALGGSLRYEYDAGGRPTRIARTGPAGAAPTASIEIEYDLLGRKVALRDPDKGSWSYAYDGFDQLVLQTDARSNQVQIEYDALGRKREQRNLSFDPATDSWTEEEHTRWRYDSAAHGIGQPAYVEQVHSGYREVYHYDALGRPERTETQLAADGAESFARSVTYDAFDRVEVETDALDGLAGASGVRHVYNASGYRSHDIDLATGDTVYRVLEQDARGQVTREQRGNGLETEYGYAPASGRLVRERTPGLLGLAVQDLRYDWDAAGNLTSRSDGELRESFCYDALRRLTKSAFESVDCASLPETRQDLRYDALGNITYKAGVGSYHYGDGAGPEAVTSTSGGARYRYDANGSLIGDSSGRELAYTALDQVRRIRRADLTIELTYGPDGSRYRRVDSDAAGARTTTLYLGSVERISRSGETAVRWRRYVGGAALDLVTTGADGQLTARERVFLHKDALGSLTVITDAAGAVLERSGFDAWGLRRSPLDGRPLDPLARAGFEHRRTARGFTGHEMLDEVGIIHMNGRIYDPELGRFLQADPFVQLGGDGQLFNRYGYGRNNPLNVTDPSGHFLALLVGAVLAASGASTGVVIAATAVAAFAEALLQGASARDALIAGVSAGAFSFIGGVSPGAGLAAVVANGVQLGVVGGVTSALQGGNFGHGFVCASLGGVANLGFLRDVRGSAGLLVQIGTRAIVGGTAAALSGEKFANGARSAALAAALAATVSAGAESWHERRAAALDGGESPELTSPQQSGETTLEIRYNEATGPAAHHAYIVVTGPDGSQFYTRAGPASRVNGVGSPGALGGRGIFGEIYAESGAFVPRSIDFAAADASLVLLRTHDPLAYPTIIHSLLDYAAAVNRAHISYNALTRNSNSYAHQAPEVLGLPRPDPPVWAPGHATALELGSRP